MFSNLNNTGRKAIAPTRGGRGQNTGHNNTNQLASLFHSPAPTNVSNQPVGLQSTLPVFTGQNFNLVQANGGNQGIKLPELTNESGMREVDTYQIAVPNGDCSIHLMVLRPAYGDWANHDRPRGKIEKAVLMDGGNSGGGGVKIAADIITRAIKVIRRNYDNPEVDDYVIKFDAWVITHWDRDHWGGALHMLKNSQIGNCIHTSKYFKYDGTLRMEPLTKLYCPNWTEVAKFLQHEGFEQPVKTKEKPSDLIIIDTELAESEGRGIAYLKRNPQNYKRWGGFCQAIWGHRRLLGVDYFTGNICYGNSQVQLNPDYSYDRALNQTLKSFNTLQILMANDDRARYDHPRFFCIGAAGFILGADAPESAVLHALAMKKSGKSDTWANLSSLMSVLHFPQQNYVSLYWAGDAVEIMEKSFVADRPNIGGRFFDGYTFNVAKWSHHGSKHSSPRELWERLEARQFVVSPNKKGTYTHPHPNVIRQLHSLAGPGIRLYSTFYPGWFKKPKAYVNLTISEKMKQVMDERKKQLTEGEALVFLPEVLAEVRELKDIWEDMCSVQEKGIFCPAYFIDQDENDAIKPLPKISPQQDSFRHMSTLDDNTAPLTYQNLFIHIISSHHKERDGIIKYYADMRPANAQELADDDNVQNLLQDEEEEDITFEIDRFMEDIDRIDFSNMDLSQVEQAISQNFKKQGILGYENAYQNIPEEDNVASREGKEEEDEVEMRYVNEEVDGSYYGNNNDNYTVVGQQWARDFNARQNENSDTALLALYQTNSGSSMGQMYASQPRDNRQYSQQQYDPQQYNQQNMAYHYNNQYGQYNNPQAQHNLITQQTGHNSQYNQYQGMYYNPQNNYQAQQNIMMNQQMNYNNQHSDQYNNQGGYQMNYSQNNQGYVVMGPYGNMTQNEPMNLEDDRSQSHGRGLFNNLNNY